MLFFISCQTHNQEFHLAFEPDGSIHSIEESFSGLQWSTSPTPVYFLDTEGDIEAEATFRKVSALVYEWQLTIKNNSTEAHWVEPHFPYIDQWKVGGAPMEQIYQLFPRQGEMANNDPIIRYEEVYSGNFPFQFMDISNGNTGGLMFHVMDESNSPKKFYLERETDRFDLGVIHRGKMLSPGETWVMPVVEVSIHTGDWHQAFYRYRNWLKEVLTPVLPRKEWFRDVYNFRQTFLYNNSGEKGAYDIGAGKVDLKSKVKESAEAFGGVDYLHLFDWGQTPDQGRCGDYDPWHYLNKESLKEEIQWVKSQGIPVGLYHEGYLLSPTSQVCKEFGSEWQMLDSNQNRYARFGSGYYYPCPLSEEWREYIAGTVLRSSGELGADGVYIDQFGFGWQYGCFNPEHAHDTHVSSIPSELQVPSEAGLMNHIKSYLPSSVVTYTEECPTDISTQYQDGSFTYAICVGRDSSRHNPAVVNLARFAFPDYKLIEILHVDEPIQNDIDGIRHIFFNGEGIWLSGPLSDSNWFPESLRQEIRKCYPVLTQHADAFRSLEPEPLVATLNDQIKANYFPVSGKRLWTFYNISEQSHTGNLLEVEAAEGAVYYDAFRNIQIEPVKHGKKHLLELTIAGKDVGCIVQLLP